MRAWLALTLAACRDPSAPGLPADAARLEPLPPYRTWWNLVQACADLTGDYAAVSWYAAPRVDPGDSTIRARWQAEGNRIVLDAGVIWDGRVVRHEMLHALLRRTGHPPAWFAEGCAELVACEHGCAPPESARGVPGDATVISPFGLTVSATVEPQPPNGHADEGWFRIKVTATNPNSEPVWVTLPDGNVFGLAEDQSPPSTGPYAKPRGTLRRVPAVEERWAFRAGESRHTTFDVRWPPRTYNVRISFSSTEQVLVLLVVP